MSEDLTGNKYIITSALMGFGHLRAAHNVSSVSGAPVVRVDRKPFVNVVDEFVWNGAQRIHTYASRDAESKNRLLYDWFEGLMTIQEDHKPPSLAGSRFVHFLKDLGVGGRFFNSLNRDYPALLHTFYLQAMISVYRRYPGRNYLLLCDTDFHRVWVPISPNEGNIVYMVPVPKSADRLISYGVPPDRIHITGFPLPSVNTGPRDLGTLISDFEIRKRRLKRDSTVPLTIMFPFSGAGAYSNVLAELVKTLLDHLRDGNLRLIVSCGDNEHALRNAENLFVNYGLDECEFAEIIFEKNLFDSFDKFNFALKSVDMIITKPSEMVFYAALGIPMVFLPPIGDHEARNREYLIDNKCAVDMATIRDFPGWLNESRKTGQLLELAEMGFQNLPKTGSFEIDQLVRGAGVGEGKPGIPEPLKM
ncbi:MAG: hypothetical protein M1469_04280 [Bacteroidetes bacterium]|nr:hypothetical protein [Bacteroidota bacterium]